MHHARVVRRLQPVTRLHQVPDRGAEIDRLRHPILQALPGEQLHADVPVALVHADVIEADDVRVDELPRKLQLLLEPRHQHVRRLLHVKDLQSDLFLELQIVRAEDGRHSPLADLSFEPVARSDGTADSESIGGRRRLGLDDHFRFREHFLVLPARRAGIGHPRDHLRIVPHQRRFHPRELAEIGQVRQALALVQVGILQHLPRHHRRRPQLGFELPQPLARAGVIRLPLEHLLQRLARVLRISARRIETRQQIEHRQLVRVLRSALHVRAEEMLEAEVEHVEVRRHPHRARRGSPVARVVLLHPAEIVERLAGVAQLQVALGRLKRQARVGIELRRIRGPLQLVSYPRRVAEALELRVRLQRQLQLTLLFQLLRREYRHRLPADGRRRLGQHRPGLELPRLRRREPRRAHRIARALQQFHRARLLAERHVELYRQLVLARLGEEDGGHQRALLAGRVELSRLRRLHAERFEQQLARIARPLQRTGEHAGRVFGGARFAKQLHRRLALPGLFERPRLLDGLFLIHQSSGSCAARLFRDSG